MNIALIGYGKMGHAIEQAAVKRGHTVTLRITSANKNEMDAGHLQNADIAIEFTTPGSAKENVLKCMAAGINVICGTTGWNDHIHDAVTKANELNVGFLHASNFSVGVNIFFEVNKLLASLMKGRDDYAVAIEETHHTAKKDAPSGTAITIADQIVENLGGKKKWVLNDPNDKEAVPIFSYRIEDVPGKHKVIYSSPIDNIEITHDAHNRDGFAMGAVLAAEFMAGKKGVYTMKDVLGIK